jgi:hypothetical protein
MIDKNNFSISEESVHVFFLSPFLYLYTANRKRKPNIIATKEVVVSKKGIPLIASVKGID